jgi:phage terminase small subunit
MGEKILTNLQQRFVNCILKGMNQTDAYLEAGYKCTRSSARRNAARLMTNADILTEIIAGQKKAAEKAAMTAEELLYEEKIIGSSNIAKLFDENGVLIPPHKLPEDVAKTISGIDVKRNVDGSIIYKYRLWTKGQSLERSSRRLGLYKKDHMQKFKGLREILEEIDGKGRCLPSQDRKKA